MDGPIQRLRPFFRSAENFAAATSRHFDFLVGEFHYSGPIVEESDLASFDVRYDGHWTSVLLSWDSEGGYLGIHLIPRGITGHLDPDPDNWLQPNEILSARGAGEAAVMQHDLDGVDANGYAQVMERAAANLHMYCADVLRGDWSVFGDARRWFEEHPELQ